MSASTIQCAASARCQHKRYYHNTCKGIEDPSAMDEWWCSEHCFKFTTFCCGRTIPNADWVGCENGDSCNGTQWYHLQCVNLKYVPSK